MIRFLIAGPLWIAVAPAFCLHWLPWWYTAPILLGASISEAGAEALGRREATGEQTP